MRILERNKELEAGAGEARARTTPSVTLGAGGLSVSTADTNFLLKIRGYVQADWRTFMNTDFKGGGKANGEVTAQDEDLILARIQLSFRIEPGRNK